jgi:hypothetical protein
LAPCFKSSSATSKLFLNAEIIKGVLLEVVTASRYAPYCISIRTRSRFLSLHAKCNAVQLSKPLKILLKYLKLHIDVHINFFTLFNDHLYSFVVSSFCCIQEFLI